MKRRITHECPRCGRDRQRIRWGGLVVRCECGAICQPIEMAPAQMDRPIVVRKRQRRYSRRGR